MISPRVTTWWVTQRVGGTGAPNVPHTLFRAHRASLTGSDEPALYHMGS